MAVRQQRDFARRDDAGARRRRTLAAFVLGAAISAAGLAAFASYPSLAHGPFSAAHPTEITLTTQGSSRAAYDPFVVESDPQARYDEDYAPRRHRITVIAGHSERPAAGVYAGSQPVCVRLCDGYFFPLPTSAASVDAQSAACNSLCPDAPTEVFYRNGGDRIDSAVSAHGQLYKALPVSLRYSRVSENTCSCHRSAVAYAPLKDATLRPGDAVMTPAGFMVFRGHMSASHAPGEFMALAGAPLRAGARNALLAMERASLAPAHPALKDWLVSQAPGARQVALQSAASTRVDDRIRLVGWSGAPN